MITRFVTQGLDVKCWLLKSNLPAMNVGSRGEVLSLQAVADPWHLQGRAFGTFHLKKLTGVVSTVIPLYFTLYRVQWRKGPGLNLQWHKGP